MDKTKGLVPCLECPRNSFSGEPPTGGFKDCQACPSNTYTFQPAAPTKDRCRSKCSPGFYSPTGLAPCSPCPQNFYQNLPGSATCNECPTNMKTDNQASVGREDCKPVVCTENSCQHGGLCVPMGHSVQWWALLFFSLSFSSFHHCYLKFDSTSLFFIETASAQPDFRDVAVKSILMNAHHRLATMVESVLIYRKAIAVSVIIQIYQKFTVTEVM